MSYKRILVPISVPDSDYCWDGEYPCEHFDNEGGIPICHIFSLNSGYDKNGHVRKPPFCLKARNDDT